MMERQAKTDSSPADGRTEIPVETMFDVLNSSYRRHVLSYLSDTTGTTRMDDLAYHVAAWEADTDIAEISDDDAQETEILLYHVHLPKMASVGLVSYDAESKTVAPGESIESATRCIRVVE